MNIYIAILLCFIPFAVLFAVSVFAVKVHPLYALLASALGLIAVLPITFLQFYAEGIPLFSYGTYSGELLKALILNGLIEEALKMAVLFILPAKKIQLPQFFMCALLCGLTLGCFESAIYFLQHLQRASTAGAVLLYRQIFIRMFTADMVHVFCTGLCGLFVWAVRHKKDGVFAFVYAVALHGLYNFFTLYTTGIHWFAFAALLFAAVECRIRYQSLNSSISSADAQKK